MLPTYLVIGAPKCGTSSLCYYLGKHPDVFMAEEKEIHYFGRKDPEKTPAWYESFFEQATGATAIGEGSTSYTKPQLVNDAARQIAALLPDCRLIYMVRNPLKRLESDWKMASAEGWAVGTSINDVDRMPWLLDQGFYWRNISPYRERFPDDQILIVFLEDFSRNPDAELARCFAHIGVVNVQIDGSGEPLNTAAGHVTYHPLGRALRALPRFENVKNIAPRWMVNAGKALLTKPQRFEVQWEPAVRDRVVATFVEESKPFLEWCGKPPDFWTYD
jgi:Sulfotransferase domain